MLVTVAGTHIKEDVMGETSTTSSWSFTTVQRLLMTGTKEGARIGARHLPVRVASPAASTLEEAFPEDVLRTAATIQRRLVTDVKSAVPGPWEMLETVMTKAVEASLVIGARAIAGAASPDPATEPDLVERAEDELWLQDHVAELLSQVVHAIGQADIPLPGAQRYLEQMHSSMPPQILELSNDAGEVRELRTDWLVDADTAEVYQWCVGEYDRALKVSKRLRGRRSVETKVEILGRDVPVVIEMLARFRTSA